MAQAPGDPVAVHEQLRASIAAILAELQPVLTGSFVYLDSVWQEILDFSFPPSHLLLLGARFVLPLSDACPQGEGGLKASKSPPALLLVGSFWEHVKQDITALLSSKRHPRVTIAACFPRQFEGCAPADTPAPTIIAVRPAPCLLTASLATLPTLAACVPRAHTPEAAAGGGGGGSGGGAQSHAPPHAPELTPVDCAAWAGALVALTDPLCRPSKVRVHALGPCAAAVADAVQGLLGEAGRQHDSLSGRILALPTLLTRGGGGGSDGSPQAGQAGAPARREGQAVSLVVVDRALDFAAPLLQADNALQRLLRRTPPPPHAPATLPLTNRHFPLIFEEKLSVSMDATPAAAAPAAAEQAASPPHNIPPLFRGTLATHGVPTCVRLLSDFAHAKCRDALLRCREEIVALAGALGVAALPQPLLMGAPSHRKLCALASAVVKDSQIYETDCPLKAHVAAAHMSRLSLVAAVLHATRPTDHFLEAGPPPPAGPAVTPAGDDDDAAHPAGVEQPVAVPRAGAQYTADWLDASGAVFPEELLAVLCKRAHGLAYTDALTPAEKVLVLNALESEQAVLQHLAEFLATAPAYVPVSALADVVLAVYSMAGNQVAFEWERHHEVMKALAACAMDHNRPLGQSFLTEDVTQSLCQYRHDSCHGQIEDIETQRMMLELMDALAPLSDFIVLAKKLRAAFLPPALQDLLQAPSPQSHGGVFCTLVKQITRLVCREGTAHLPSRGARLASMLTSSINLWAGAAGKAGKDDLETQDTEIVIIAVIGGVSLEEVREMADVAKRDGQEGVTFYAVSSHVLARAPEACFIKDLL